MYTIVDANNKTNIQKINEKYKVGDAISEEDIKIIEKEADWVNVDGNTDANTQSLSVTYYNVFGTARTPDNVHEVDISGTTIKEIGITGGSVSGNLKTSVVKGAYNSTIVEYHYSGYGFDGGGVFRKLAEVDVSNTSGTDSSTIVFNRNFDGYILASSQYAYGTVTWSGGSLQANGYFYEQ